MNLLIGVCKMISRYAWWCIWQWTHTFGYIPQNERFMSKEGTETQPNSVDSTEDLTSTYSQNQTYGCLGMHLRKCSSPFTNYCQVIKSCDGWIAVWNVSVNPHLTSTLQVNTQSTMQWWSHLKELSAFSLDSFIYGLGCITINSWDIHIPTIMWMGVPVNLQGFVFVHYSPDIWWSTLDTKMWIWPAWN